MNKRFLVVAIFLQVVKTQDEFSRISDEKTTERKLLVESLEGDYDTRYDAEQALAAMIEEESQNDDLMYFDIREVYGKNKREPIPDSDDEINRQIHETNERIKREYPVQDLAWASRRWKEDGSDYRDLSGYHGNVPPKDDLRLEWE